MTKNMRKLGLSLLTAAILTTAAGAAETAKPSTHNIYVDGEQVSAGAYEILGNNYFKLRDLAAMLNGSEKQFEVTWSEDDNAIGLISGQAYTAVGGELAPVGAANQTANPTDSVIYKDRTVADLAAYNVNYNNYFKLRDIGEAFDFYVGWNEDEQRVDIITTKGYGEDEATPQPEQPVDSNYSEDAAYKASGMPTIPGLEAVPNPTADGYGDRWTGPNRNYREVVTVTINTKILLSEYPDNIEIGNASGAKVELVWRPTDKVIATGVADANGSVTLTFDIRMWELANTTNKSQIYELKAYGMDKDGTKYSNVRSTGIAKGEMLMLSSTPLFIDQVWNLSDFHIYNHEFFINDF